jgi:hypothetical protein
LQVFSDLHFGQWMGQLGFFRKVRFPAFTGMLI